MSNRFKDLASKLVQETFGQYAKKLSIVTVNGSTENGEAIDITHRFVVDGSEDTELKLVTNVDQWVKDPTAGNIDCVFDRVPVKILSVDKDAAQAAYFITCKTYDRQSISIQTLTATPDGSGGYTEVWAEHVSAEAEVTFLDASESMKAGRIETGQGVKFYFRYAAGITEKMRVLFDGEYLPIRSINNINAANEWIELICERKRAS